MVELCCFPVQMTHYIIIISCRSNPADRAGLDKAKPSWAKIWTIRFKNQDMMGLLFSSLCGSLSVCLSVCLPACLSVYVCVCLSLSLTLFYALSLCLSVCVSLWLSLSVCLSVSLSLSRSLSLNRADNICLWYCRVYLCLYYRKDWLLDRSKWT